MPLKLELKSRTKVYRARSLLAINLEPVPMGAEFHELEEGQSIQLDIQMRMACGEQSLMVRPLMKLGERHLPEGYYIDCKEVDLPTEFDTIPAD